VSFSLSRQLIVSKKEEEEKNIESIGAWRVRTRRGYTESSYYASLCNYIYTSTKKCIIDQLNERQEECFDDINYRFLRARPADLQT